jgi:pilus assembly protein CpaF
VFSIVISEKGGAERRETFEQNEVTVGRVQGNDLMLPKGNVSKRHCRLEQQNGRFVVSDQESTNGTYVNRRRITQSTVVREGDRIYVGDFILRIEQAGVEPALEVPVPSPTSEEFPARAPQLTAADPERPSQGNAAPPAGPRSTPDTGAKSLRDSDVSADLNGVLTLATSLLQRVASSHDARALDRELDAAAERRVERLVNDAFNEVAIAGMAPQGVSEAKVKELVLDELLRLGPLGRLIEDHSVQEISVTGAGYLVVLRGGQRSSKELPFCLASSVARAALRLCRQAGVDLPDSAGASRIALPKLGLDLEFMGSAIVPGAAALRLTRRERSARSLEDLVRAGVISRTIATFLKHCVVARVNIVVVGAARSGASDVLAALATSADGERVFGLASEESPASGLDNNLVWLDAPEERVSQVLRSSGNFAGHRLLVDGLAGARASATLAAIGEGAQGVLVRMKARGLERGLARLCTDTSLRTSGLTPEVVAEALVSSFDLALEVTRLPDGRSRVVRVAELERAEAGLLRGVDIFDFSVERTATGGSIEGTFRATGHSPRLAGELKNHGVRFDVAIFSRPPISEER